MRRQTVLLLVVLVVALGAAAGPAFAQPSPKITYRKGAESGDLALYRFRFEPAASIPGPYPEPMLATVSNGLFLLYLGSGARVVLDPREAASTTIQTLTPVGASGTERTFADEPENNGPTFVCAPTCTLQADSSGVQVAGGPTLGDVGIKLTVGAVVHFFGPTSAFVCNVGENNGRIVVAVYAPNPFWWLQHATQDQNASAAPAGEALAPPSAPATGAARFFLPPLNPGGGCAGRVG